MNCIVKGYDNRTTNKPALTEGAKYILQQIQISRAEIEKQMMEEVKIIQKSQPKINVEKLREQIENFKQKKRNAIDLVLDGLISKDDLAEQNAYYDEQIAVDYYLNCVSFGYCVKYHMQKTNMYFF